MTTRRVERRHREAAARARWPLAYGNGEPLANWLQAWVDQEADYTGVDGAALLAIANAIAAAEQPAPSAPAEFDPFTALLQHVSGGCEVISAEQVGDSEWLVERIGQPDVHAKGPTIRDAAVNLCRKLGLTESPKGKEE